MAQTRSRAVQTLPGMANAARATRSWPISSNWPKTSLAAPRSRFPGAGAAEISRACRKGWHTRCHICLDERSTGPIVTPAGQEFLARLAQDPGLTRAGPAVFAPRRR